MCGIVGILGHHEAAPILVEALKRLEYRGYDSAGIATIHDGRLDRRRAVGKLVNLSDLLVHEPLAGKSGIGQTRWATHGAVTQGNAHPHRSGPVSVVHNGIIENFRELREELAAKGLAHETETDSEVAAILVRQNLDLGLSPAEAVAKAVARLNGAFALAFLFDGEDDLMIGARKGAPLAVGYGEGEMYLGSDAIALAPMTNRIAYLEDGDYVVLTREGATIHDAEGRLANREVTEIHVDATRIEKDGYKHFMAKEIAQQPAVLADAIAAYSEGGKLVLPKGLEFAALDRLTMVACGSGYLACLVAKYWFEQIARLPCEVDVASEFRYREPPFAPNSAALFVSQSGETADTLAALRYSRNKADRIWSLINVPTSSIAREADLSVPILAGVEVSVASTKAFTNQLVILALMALQAGLERGHLTPAQVSDHLADLARLPGFVSQALTAEPQIIDIAAWLAEARDVLFLGRGPLFPLALEGALKLKELSYIHAEGYPSGELKHGPIALIDRTVPVVVFAPHDRLFDKTVSNMQEVMARNGQVVLITDAKGAEVAGDGTRKVLTLPQVPDLLAPIVYAIPAQLLAYHTAIAKGTDVDQPRNLAKSVTVE